MRIEKHDNRLCFRNPGTLKLPIEEIYEGGNSKARNPKMQDMLRMIGFGENLSSGFPKILDAWKEAKWNAPTLEDRLVTGEVRLTLPVPFAEAENVTDDVHKDVHKILTERQIVILEMIRMNVHITRIQLSTKLKVNEKTVRRDLEVLQTEGYIKREGGRKEGFWSILKE